MTTPVIVIPEHATVGAVFTLRGKNVGSYGANEATHTRFACSGQSASEARVPFMGTYTVLEFLRGAVAFATPRCVECTRLVLEALSIRTHPTKTRWK